MCVSKYKIFHLKLVGIIFLFVILISCKKTIVPSAPSSISGPTNLCPGENNVVYSINPVNGSTYYLWTVPDGAKIISGQGTTSITVNFGKKIGDVCVRANNDQEVSAITCLNVKQGGISNQWCQGFNFPGVDRQQGVAFTIGNKGYFGTGFSATTNLRYKDFWEYDPIENAWSQKADFGGAARYNAVGFVINNKGYIGTGEAITAGVGYLSDFWEYDPALDSWTKKADYNIPSTYCFSFSMGNKGYVGGGANITTPAFANSDFYEFDPSVGTLGTWTKKANLLVARSSACGFSIGNKGYYGLGSDLSVYEKRFMEYDPTDLSNGTDVNGNPRGKWSFVEDFKGNKRNAAIAFTIGNKAYVGGGFDGVINYNDFYEFDPSVGALGTWTQKTNIPPIGRKYASSFSIGDNGYVMVGANTSTVSLNDLWIYAK
jgi:N-acetylneuraminic acid mutarotase